MRIGISSNVVLAMLKMPLWIRFDKPGLDILGDVLSAGTLPHSGAPLGEKRTSYNPVSPLVPVIGGLVTYHHTVKVRDCGAVYGGKDPGSDLSDLTLVPPIPSSPFSSCPNYLFALYSFLLFFRLCITIFCSNLALLLPSRL